MHIFTWNKLLKYIVFTLTFIFSLQKFGTTLLNLIWSKN